MLSDQKQSIQNSFSSEKVTNLEVMQVSFSDQKIYWVTNEQIKMNQI